MISRCTRPTLTRRAISTYTVFAFAGYFVASVVCGVLSVAWELTLPERLIGLFAPPLAFLIVALVSSAIAGHERIVFYQGAFGAVIATAIIAAVTGVRVARLVDLVTLGIGTLLVFGRLGCFAVACCHGTLGRGVVYGPDHVRIGFWARWEGRSLWPVQLLESIASGILVLVAFAVGASSPGDAAAIYIIGYGALRFTLELVRGDVPRPYLRGISEAQWLALTSVTACAIVRPSPLSVVVTGALAVVIAVLAARVRNRELFQPPHLREFDARCQEILDDSAHARRETSLGVALSCHALPDGRLDWVLSSSHPAWSLAAAHRIAVALWRDREVIAGRTPGVVHVVVPASTVIATDQRGA